MVLNTIKKTIKTHGLIERKDRILIAYSGGPDSTALLSLLQKLRKEWDFEILLAHFNHRLRRRAWEDEQFVREVARKSGFPLFLGTEDVRRCAKERRWNTEEAARKLRYDFLKRTATKVGATKIATGHTLSDQAETFLMRLLRGSGIRGLAGIYPVVEGMIIRPLIEVERKDIEAYLEEKRISYRVDESNFDRRFFRNRIRMDLIPYIQRNYDPGIIPRLGRAASILQEEEALLDEWAKAMAREVIVSKDGQPILKRRALSSLPLAMQRRVVREFVLRLKGDLRDISFKDVESILALGKGKMLPLKKDIVLERDGDSVLLREKPFPQADYEYRWNGETPLVIKEIEAVFEGRRVKKERVRKMDFDDERVVFVDGSMLHFPLIVRNRREGDRYQPLGSPGKKKLKEMMRAKSIPLVERERRPIFLSGHEIIWVLGLPVAEKFKIQESTDDIFMISKS